MSVKQMLTHAEAGTRRSMDAQEASAPARRDRIVTITRDLMSGSTMMRKKKQSTREDGRAKSMSLLDVGIPDENTTHEYVPMVVPYFYDRQEKEDSKEIANKDAPKKSKRPEMAVIDEANRNAATVLVDDSGKLKEDQFFCVQLPATLPKGDVDQDVDMGDNITSGIDKFPSGQIGKMRVYKSGKVEFVMGSDERAQKNLVFNVDQGAETHFDQQLACVCGSENEVMFLGSVPKRIIVTPDIDAMLSVS